MRCISDVCQMRCIKRCVPNTLHAQYFANPFLEWPVPLPFLRTLLCNTCLVCWSMFALKWGGISKIALFLMGLPRFNSKGGLCDSTGLFPNILMSESPFETTGSLSKVGFRQQSHDCPKLCCICGDKRCVPNTFYKNESPSSENKHINLKRVSYFLPDLLKSWPYAMEWLQ